MCIFNMKTKCVKVTASLKNQQYSNMCKCNSRYFYTTKKRRVMKYYSLNMYFSKNNSLYSIAYHLI